MINLNPLYKEDLPKSVAIFKGQDSIKFLKFMTPFANELLEDALVKDLEVDESFADRVVESVLGSKSQEDRVIDWVCSGFKQVLKILDEQNRDTRLLRNSLRQYLDLFKDSGMPTGTLKLAKAICEGRCDEAIREFDQKIKVKTFESDVLVRFSSSSYLYAEDYRPFFETDDSRYLYCLVSVTAKSIAYLLYTYLASALIKGSSRLSIAEDEDTTVWLANTVQIQYAFPGPLVKADFQYEKVKNKVFVTPLADVLYELEFYSLEAENAEGVQHFTSDFDGPMWMFQVPQRFKVDNFDIHLSRFPLQEYITIKPSNFKSRVADYKNAPFLSSRRTEAKLVTRSKHPRSIGFAWDAEAFCKMLDDLKSDEENVSNTAGEEMVRLMNFFGRSGIFITSNFALECLYTNDMDLQTIFLLSDVTSTVPFCTFPNNFSMESSNLVFNYNPQTEQYSSLSQAFYPYSPSQYFQAVCALHGILQKSDLGEFGKTLNTCIVDFVTHDIRIAAMLYVWFADRNGLDTSFAKGSDDYPLAELLDMSKINDVAKAYGGLLTDVVHWVHSQVEDKDLRMPNPRSFKFLEYKESSISDLFDEGIVLIKPPKDYKSTLVRPIIGLEQPKDSVLYIFADPEYLLSTLGEDEYFPICIYEIPADSIDNAGNA